MNNYQTLLKIQFLCTDVNLPELKALLDLGDVNPEDLGPSLFNTLDSAAVGQKFEAFKLLLDYGVSAESLHSDQDGVWTPYYRVIRNGLSVDWLEALFEKGAIEQSHQKIREMNLIEWACVYGTDKHLDFFLTHKFFTGRRISQEPMKWENLLGSCIGSECTHFMGLNKMEKLLDYPPFSHILTQLSLENIWRALEEKKFMNFFEEAHEINLKIKEKADSILEKILQKVLCIDDPISNTRITRVMQCCSKEYPGFLKILLNRGASILQEDNDGDTVAHWFFYGKYENTEKRRKILDLLLEAGVDFEKTNKHGETALSLLSIQMNYNQERNNALNEFKSVILRHQLGNMIPNTEKTKKLSSRI